MLAVLRAGSFDRIGNHNLDHFSTAAGALARPFLTKFYLQTIGADPCRDHTRNAFAVRIGKHHHDFFIPTEIQVVEGFKVRHGGIAAFIEYGYPAGNTTVTAVYNRKILLCLLRIQIASDLISDFLRIYFRN